VLTSTRGCLALREVDPAGHSEHGDIRQDVEENDDGHPGDQRFGYVLLRVDDLARGKTPELEPGVCPEDQHHDGPEVAQPQGREGRVVPEELRIEQERHKPEHYDEEERSELRKSQDIVQPARGFDASDDYTDEDDDEKGSDDEVRLGIQGDKELEVVCEHDREDGERDNLRDAHAPPGDESPEAVERRGDVCVRPSDVRDVVGAVREDHDERHRDYPADYPDHYGEGAD
jgi:hypothetical protein